MGRRVECLAENYDFTNIFDSHAINEGSEWEWKIKIIKKEAFVIGIIGSNSYKNEDYPSDSVYKQSHGYAYYDGEVYHDYDNHDGNALEEEFYPCQDGDIVIVNLNLRQYTLSFQVNDKQTQTKVNIKKDKYKLVAGFASKGAIIELCDQ